MKLATLVSLLLFASTAIHAAEGPRGLESYKAHLLKSKEYTLAVAQAMPADQYKFKASPEEMTFGEQMMHIARDNEETIGMVVGEKTTAPAKVEPTKENVLKSLTTSFDTVLAKLDKATAAQFDAQISLGAEGKMTGRELVAVMLDHTTHHRAQCIVYLRIKGIKPPAYRW